MIISVLVTLAFTVARASHSEQVVAPIAPEIAHDLKMHGDVRADPYHWLRDRDDPRVLRYLKSENEYANARIAGFRTSVKTLKEEMKSHVKPTDATVPYRDGAFEYWERTEKDREYPVSLRRLPGKPRTEQVILDQNEIAAGSGYASIGGRAVSDDGHLLAYSVDLVGNRVYVIRIKDLRTGRPLTDEIKDTTGEVVWSANGAYVYYVRPEPGTLRSRWVYRHEVGGKTEDVAIFEESDPTFNVEVGRSLTNRLIFVVSQSFGESEVSYFAAAEPLATPRLFQKRARGILYSVADGVDRFYVRTNLGSENFRVVETPLESTSSDHWVDVIPAKPDVHLTELWVFKTHLVSVETRDGLPRIRVRARAGGKERLIEFNEPDYYAGSGANGEYASTFFRYFYESMATPEKIIDEDLRTGRRTVRRQLRVPGGFRAANYETKRLFATAADGAKIPISLVYRKGKRRGVDTPLLLYGYGAYGSVVDSYFATSHLPLLDRGFVFAVAHVRGGGELGRPWYLDGKLMKKTNSFTDFTAAAHYLIDHEWTSPKRLFAQGESAGGMLMGAVINRDPKLFRAVIAKVPFVDVLTTMLDATLPLTTGEYNEWGNPNARVAYDYIKSYSPYDNVRPGPFPNLLVRAEFNDTNVGYWEPAKWVAKIRRARTGEGLTLLKTGLETGHEGKNGRFNYLDELAEDQAFLLQFVK